MKKNIKNIIIIIAMVVVGFGVYYLIDKVANKYRWANQNDHIGENTLNSEVENNIVNKDNNIKEQQEDELVDSRTQSDITKIDISDAEIVNILIDVDLFEGAEELSTEKKLAIVYNALNENKISLYKNRGNGQAKVEYTENEVNGIVYSLFGSELKENKNYGELFVYKDGKYTLIHSDRGKEKLEAENIESDVAAGTVYINYDLYVNGVYNGRYTIGKSNVTKYVTCKKEM